ncbi:hypothetical protein ACLK1U_08770 [Escherichia coli]
MRRNGQEAVIDQRFTAISIPCIEHRMACIIDHFSVFIVTCNQHIDLVAGITVISMIKDKNTFAGPNCTFVALVIYPASAAASP